MPLSEMFGYSMEFDHYGEVPNNVAQAIIGGKAKK